MSFQGSKPGAECAEIQERDIDDISTTFQQTDTPVTADPRPVIGNLDPQ